MTFTPLYNTRKRSFPFLTRNFIQNSCKFTRIHTQLSVEHASFYKIPHSLEYLTTHSHPSIKNTHKTQAIRFILITHPTHVLSLCMCMFTICLHVFTPVHVMYFSISHLYTLCKHYVRLMHTLCLNYAHMPLLITPNELLGNFSKSDKL